jgi:hypothetical protein
MADIVPPDDKKPEGEVLPPPSNPPPANDPEFKIKELMQKQMKEFQDGLIAQLEKDYKEKLAKIQNDSHELEEKKQRLAISEELRAVGMDGGLIDFVYDKDIEISKGKIKQLKELIEIEINKGIQERLKASSYVPPKSEGNSQYDNNITKPKYFV